MKVRRFSLSLSLALFFNTFYLIVEVSFSITEEIRKLKMIRGRESGRMSACIIHGADAHTEVIHISLLSATTLQIGLCSSFHMYLTETEKKKKRNDMGNAWKCHMHARRMNVLSM